MTSPRAAIYAVAIFALTVLGCSEPPRPARKLTPDELAQQYNRDADIAYEVRRLSLLECDTKPRAQERLECADAVGDRYLDALRRAADEATP